jgi:hypothetical protein
MTMTTEPTTATATTVGPRTPYERRLRLVVTTIREHQSLDDESASALAVHVLHAIDHIPEHIR